MLRNRRVDRLPDRQSHPLATFVIPAKDEDDQALTDLKYRLLTHPYGQVEVLVVDDGSTVPLKCADIRHAQSQGYGAALKAGILAAKSNTIVTLDGDGQHSAIDAFRVLDAFLYLQPLEMLIGDRRVKERSLKRFLGRKALNMLASLFAWRWISDLNSGLRAFHRQSALSYNQILCNSFSFTTSFTMSVLTDDLAVDWIPIKVVPRPRGQSHVHVLKDGWITLKYIVWIGMALRTRTLRNRFRPLWAWARPS